MFALLRRAHQHSFRAYMLEHLFGRFSRYFRIILRLLARCVNRFRPPASFVPGETPARILVLSDVNGLGDAVLFRRLLQPLSAVSELTVACKRYHHPVYEAFLSSDRLFANDVSYFRPCPASRHIVREYDALLLHGYSFRNALLTLFLGSKIPIIGISFPAGHGTAATLEQFSYPHVLALYAAGARLLRVSLLPEFPRPDNAPSIQRDVLVHIGSGSPCKNWCFRHFSVLKERLHEARFTVEFVGGSKDIAFLEGYCDWRALPVRRLTSYTDYRDAVLSSRLVVCHNTSVLHLAAAYGIPTVSINQEMDYRWWHPYREHGGHTAFTAGGKVENDVREKYRVLVRHRRECGNPVFDEITPEMVLDAVREHLEHG